jgi:hypothetical protein
MKIDLDKLDEALRNIGVVFFTLGATGMFFEYSLLGGATSVIIGVACILFGSQRRYHGRI